MENLVIFQRLEQKRKDVEYALKQTQDPQLIREYNALIDILAKRLCEVA